MKTVDFSYIRYANCWEDADILIKYGKPNKDDAVLSIASGGDNSFAFLANNVKSVIAIDISLAQINLCNLKKEAIRELSYQDYLKFIGVTACDHRMSLYTDLLMKNLNEENRKWWAANQNLIKNGLIHAGKFERYFGFFRKFILPLIHSHADVERLLAPKTSLEQMDFYHKIWNTKRWQLLFAIFFSKYVIGKYGRDPEFLRQIEVNSVSDYIFQKAEIHLQSTSCQSNFMLEYIFKGNYKSNLPYYIHAEAYYKIKSTIDNIHFIHSDIANISKQVSTKFNLFNLSNIFEYMDWNEFKTSAQLLAQLGNSGSKYMYWNLMTPRKLENTMSGYKEIFLNQTKNNDKGFFYSSFNIDELI